MPPLSHKPVMPQSTFVCSELGHVISEKEGKGGDKACGEGSVTPRPKCRAHISVSN